MSEGIQVWLVNNNSEPEHVFLNLKSVPTYRDLNPAQGEDSSMQGTSSQVPQYYYHTSPQYEARDQTENMQTQTPAQPVGTLCELKSRKPCNCMKSHCLKGYCECFAGGVMCSNCNCFNCHNNEKHEMERQRATKLYLGRKANANRGCTCKRSGCLKNYCECYEAGIICATRCLCVGCQNFGNILKVKSDEDTGTGSVVTVAVVEAVCGSLLVQAESAESAELSRAQAERVVLEQFNDCLTQITKAMFTDD
ncbi:hypothetical protein JOB18_045025 [Solea senegalensis]|uniref:CRC domain-containing protein n=2 Tax=Solea senegalensis TaxID=28829 RepID=A0AAV6PIM5_SOLSE|nr:spexin prohormone 2 [Solea senegalensis]KAG7462358.1 hypothetical protein JOB18_045025 [Solea senegalensis]